MTGRYVVSLQRVTPCCPSCGAPRRVSTWRHRGTVVEPSCDPRRCPIARTLLLAGRWADVREILPSDDRHASRAMFAGGAA